MIEIYERGLDVRIFLPLVQSHKQDRVQNNKMFEISSSEEYYS